MQVHLLRVEGRFAIQPTVFIFVLSSESLAFSLNNYKMKLVTHIPCAYRHTHAMLSIIKECALNFNMRCIYPRCDAMSTKVTILVNFTCIEIFEAVTFCPCFVLVIQPHL